MHLVSRSDFEGSKMLKYEHVFTKSNLEIVMGNKDWEFTSGTLYYLLKEMSEVNTTCVNFNMKFLESLVQMYWLFLLI